MLLRNRTHMDDMRSLVSEPYVGLRWAQYGVNARRVEFFDENRSCYGGYYTLNYAVEKGAALVLSIRR